MPTRRPSRRRSQPAPAIRLLGGAGTDGLPLHRRVYRQLRDHILGGALAPGARLPSSRSLAADLSLSRNTVEAALAQLAAEGFIRRRTGSGTYVSATLAQSAPFAATPAGAAGAGSKASYDAATLSARGRLTAQLGATEIEADAQVGPCATDVAGFPIRTWHRLLARRMRDSGATTLLPADSLGVRPLRDAIAEYLRLARGVHCDARQVLVVNGTQQALDLAARLLMDPGTTAAMEEPGYPSALAAFRAAGLEVAGVPVDGEGMVVRALERNPEARLAYVTPSHQYPLGVTMSLCRRLDLVRWATTHGGWIFEDDYDSEFRYDGRPLAALQSVDPTGRTLYAGTFNKVLFPGLRIAYLVLPPALVDAFAAGRRLLDGFTPALPQLVLADFIAEGHFSTHLRLMRERYLGRRDALLSAVAAHWPGHIRVGPTDTGLHAVAHLPGGTDDQRIARSAPTRGMGVYPLSHYYMAGGRLERGLLLNYAAATPGRIGKSVKALAPYLLPTRGAVDG